MRRSAKILLAVLSVSLFLPCAAAWAVVKKELRIESIPPGAKVYLPQGTRNKLLGTTPFIYKAEFHSKFSVHRLLFKKPLHEDRILKVGSGKDKIIAKLKPLSISAKPKAHTDAALRDLQARVNPVIEKELPRIMQKNISIPFELGGPVKVTRAKEGAVVILRVGIVDWKSRLKGNPSARRESFARTVWDEFGPTVVVPLATALNSIEGLKGLALDVLYDEQRYIFGVKPTIKEKMEMQCVGGMRQEMVSVSRYVDGRQQMVLETRSVWDPCIRREPVTRKTVALDPRAGVQKDRARGIFMLKLPAVADQSLSFQRISVRLKDQDGKIVYRQGNMPTSLFAD